MEHFLQGNAFALCENYSKSLERIKTLTHANCETIRRLLSFRPYVENLQNSKDIIDILTNDDYLKMKLPNLLHDCHTYILLYRVFLEFLLVLVKDLPKYPLGKYRRELYSFCLTHEVMEEIEFKECWQMITFLSKDEFVAKIIKAIKCTEEYVSNELNNVELSEECEEIIGEKFSSLVDLIDKVIDATNTDIRSTMSNLDIKTVTSRLELKEQLLQNTKERAQNINEFSKAVANTMEFIEKHIIYEYLRPLQRAPPLHELFIFDDLDSVRQQIVGAPRSAIHMALTNPHYYLQCDCCELREQSQLLPTMPDICIAYKLHLECGRLINLYDWLQAFRTVIEPHDNDDGEQISHEIQARFTRSVAELQFLGFIKMSKRKRDHAQRLTW